MRKEGECARDGGEVGAWFDRLTRDAGCAGIERGAGSPPSAGSGQASASSGQAPSAGSGQVLRRTPGRLTMNGGYEYVGSGWWEVGVALVRWDCWVLLGPGTGTPG